MIENRNVNIITDADGKKLVLINDIRFKGKRQIDWNDVKQYLEGYVGDYYERGMMPMNTMEVLTLLLVVFAALSYIDNHNNKKK